MSKPISDSRETFVGEAALHKTLTRYLSKPQQGLVMGAIREWITTCAPHSGEAAPSDEYKIAYQEGHFEGYQQARRETAADGYLYGDHEHTFDCPDDAAMMGGRKVGDRYTVTAVFYEQQEFEVTKVADEIDGDWAVRLVRIKGD